MRITHETLRVSAIGKSIFRGALTKINACVPIKRPGSWYFIPGSWYFIYVVLHLASCILMHERNMIGRYRKSVLDFLSIEKVSLGLFITAIFFSLVWAVINDHDLWLLTNLNHWAASSELVAKQVDLLNNSTYFDLMVAIVIVFLWFHGSYQTIQGIKIRRHILMLFLAFVPTYIVARILQSCVQRQRPVVLPLEVVGDLGRWTSMREGFSSWGSFPSDHAALYFLISTILFSINRRLGILAFALSTYFSITRIAIGYHWPSDILAGAIIGLGVGSIMLWAESNFKQKIDSFIAWIESHQAIAYAICFAFLFDFANGFDSILEKLPKVLITIMHVITG